VGVRAIKVNLTGKAGATIRVLPFPILIMVHKHHTGGNA
jgi:hypothetical protein